MTGGVLESSSVFLQTWAWIIIPIILIVEYAIVFALNPDYHKEIVKASSNVDDRSKAFRSHALTLAGMAFTVVAILVTLADDPSRFVDALNVLGMAIVLLFFSYEVKEVTQTRMYWYTSQEKTLGYGFLSLFISVILLYDAAIPGAEPWFLLAGFVVVAGIRFLTVKRQMAMLRNMKQQGELDS